MESTDRKKILVAVDGSEQALEAVRYISAMVDPQKTRVVLFHVGSGFPEVYWNLDTNPLYQTQKDSVKEWLADRQLAIGEFKEKAFNILENAGFKTDEIRIKTQATKTAVLNDILQESYQDYSAIAVGRTGTSRLKDLLIGSMAYKLIARVKHMPSIVIGGRPGSDKVMIALDESIEAMRGVSAFAELTRGGIQNAEIGLCHCLCTYHVHPRYFFFYNRSKMTAGEKAEWERYWQDKFRPYMDEASDRLIQAGIDPGRISRHFWFTRSNPMQKIIRVASTEGVGTVVVGRRYTAGFVDAYLRGRFSEKLISSISNVAVWVSN